MKAPIAVPPVCCVAQEGFAVHNSIIFFCGDYISRRGNAAATRRLLGPPKLVLRDHIPEF